MDATEQTVVEKKAPAKKKQKQRRIARPRLDEPAVKADGIFTGLTVTDCCDGCNVDACVISGKPYCAHPRKGGLHSAQMSEHGTMKRLQQSKRILGKQMLEARGE
jgi:hypothetical protein